MSKFTLPRGDLMVSTDNVDWIENALSHIVASEEVAKMEAIAATSDDFWNSDLSWARPYLVKDGTLTIPVKGMLLNKFPYAFGGWATGYEYVVAAVERGVADPSVRDIELDVDSPGGVVAGCFDATDRIYAMRGTKPIRAVADESAYSAAYALASAADHIAVARTGGVGSIGVIAAHMEMSGRLEQAGVKVTLIYAGKRKADGHPARPLSAEAEAQMQERCDALYDIFVSTVARNRDMEEQAVRDTEAASYMVSQAVEIGLADAQADPGTLSATADPSEQDEDEEMSKDASTVVPAVAEAANLEAQALALETAHATGQAEGASAERSRMAAIMDSEEAKDRPALAHHFAFNTDLDPEAAKAAMGAAAVETANQAAPVEEAGPSSFENAMNSGDNPEVGANDDASAPEPTRSERITKNARLFGLAGFTSKES